MTRVLAALVLAVALCGAAQADTAPPAPQAPCELPMLASLDFRTTPEGMIALPGSIDGHKGGILVDTGGIHAVVGLAVAGRLASPIKPMSMGESFIGGTRLDYGVRVDNFVLGPLSFEKIWFLVAPDRMMDGDLIGEIQPHALSGINFEIDFVKGKFNMFAKGTCPGQVVYWTKEPYARVPMEMDGLGHIIVNAMLDGKPIKAFIDTGSQNSSMSLKATSHAFGIDEKTPAIKTLGSTTINGMVSASAYRYPFASLTFDGIAVKSPNIVIMDAGRSDTRDAELIVGIGVLRQLHLFIAYDEKMLYLTAAGAH
jgi:predicted aspartyl protease